MPSLRVILSLLIALAAVPAWSQSPSPDVPPGERQAFDAAARDLCRRDVAMLGENGAHGDGRTLAFKAAMVRHLVTHCGFRAVLFEASFYDFLEIERRRARGAPVTDAILSSAIGGLWNGYRDMQPLIGFLNAEAAQGRVALGGLDDQIGSRGAFYSIEGMAADLAAVLPERRRADCRYRMRQHIRYEHSRAEPRNAERRDAVASCLAEIRTALAAQPAGAGRDRDDLAAMATNMERAIARDFMPAEQMVPARDRGIYLNFLRHAARLPRRTRIIVWAANVHVARDTALFPIYAQGPGMGALIARAYGRRAFALGFTAAGGSYRYPGTGEARPIADAPSGSLEQRALAGQVGDAAYVGPRWLRRAGRLSSGAGTDHRHEVADWGGLYDGVLVFRAGRPPERID